jgi:hypothetical protein
MFKRITHRATLWQSSALKFISGSCYDLRARGRGSDVIEGNIKEEEINVSTAKSEEKADWNLKRGKKSK